MSGQRTPGCERMKPPDSKWLVAPSPDLKAIQRMPISALPSRPTAEWSVIGFVQACWR